MAEIEIDQELLHHRYWAETDPTHRRVVHLSGDFPEDLNPFQKDGVILRAASVPDSEMSNSKSIIGRAGILHGVETGRIHRRDPATGKPTVVVEATSANTGLSMGMACNATSIPFEAIIKSDIPPPKIQAMESIGEFVKVTKHYDLTQTTVERARELGAQEGYFNPDQYGADWNPAEQERTLARQLFEQHFGRYPREDEPAIIGLPAGTMGTSIGLHRFIAREGYRTRVLPVACAPNTQTPGARSIKEILKDIRYPWESLFDVIEEGPRKEAFYLSHLSWPIVPSMPGPSFGLGFYGTLAFLHKEQQADHLDRLRNKDGKIVAYLFAPDDRTNYLNLYPSELSYEDYSHREPLTIERLFKPF